LGSKKQGANLIVKVALLVGLNKGGVMSETYLKVILISAVGGLYMIAYSLFYIGARVGGMG
jgi:hypothetical protein